MENIIRWNPEKAKILREDSSRNWISFEECVVAIESGDILDIISNPSSIFQIKKYLYSILMDIFIMIHLLRQKMKYLLRPYFQTGSIKKKYLPNK